MAFAFRRATAPKTLALAASLFLSQVVAGNDGRLDLFIDGSEGGSDSLRLTSKLEDHLSGVNCPLRITTEEPNPGAAFDAYFYALSPDGDLPDGVTRALKATVVGPQYSQAAIVVHASASIQNLSNLDSVRMAYVSDRSVTGYGDQLHLLEQAGVKVEGSKVHFTDNHFGALSLLMHGDVFVAGVDAVFADRWAEKNGLEIIAVGPQRALGGIYFRPDVPEDTVAACSHALTILRRDEKPGKSILKLFPDWLSHFTN